MSASYKFVLFNLQKYRNSINTTNVIQYLRQKIFKNLNLKDEMKRVF